ncbi:MAG TPA: hypothetical protein VGM91_10935 [Conexibacter sp.]|jgi:hypothetical protein
MSHPRWRTVTGVTLAALGMSVATAQAAPTPVDMVQNLKVAINPGKAGTKKAPRPAAIGVTISSPNAQPATTKTVSVYFGKGISFNNAKFPTCSLQQIQQANSIARCPRGSIVGRGTARAIGFLGPSQVPESLTVTAVNSTNNTLQLYVQGAAPLPIAAPITGKLAKASGKYGSRLDVTLPDALRQVLPGAYAPLVFFNVKVKATTTVKQGKRSVKVPYVQTTSCPSGGWPFRGDFSFDSAPLVPFSSDPVTAVSPNAKCS